MNEVLLTVILLGSLVSQLNRNHRRHRHLARRPYGYGWSHRACN